jgi:hypothetical protein
MKSFLVIMTVVSFLLVPVFAASQSTDPAAQPPPVAPSLVREGDFALKLVEVLKLGEAQDEAEAETILATSGIAPKNGWISDYPVTPDVIGELEKAVGEAADAKRLPMEKDEALKALRTAAVEMELPIVVELPGRYAEGPSPTTPEYAESSALDHYYDAEGPPVVTYFPPPPDYGYLYAWVPSPFFFSGYFFPGFFILHDFHKTIIVKKKVVVVSNHVVDRNTRRVLIVDPVKRSTGALIRAEERSRRGFVTPEARRGAGAIFERSRERAISRSGERALTPSGSGGPGSSPERRFPADRGRSTPGQGREERPQALEQGRTGGRAETGGRSFSRPEGLSERRGMDFQRAPESSGRSSTGENRSFTPRQRGGEGSFSSPSRGGRESRGGESKGRSRCVARC